MNRNQRPTAFPCQTTWTRTCPTRWLRSSRATPALSTRWCGENTKRQEHDILCAVLGRDPAFLAGKFPHQRYCRRLRAGRSTAWTCSAGLPNYPKGEWFDGYSADGPFEEVYKGARVFRAREITAARATPARRFCWTAFSWPLYAAGALKRLPGGYDAAFCFNTSPVLMCWPAIRYAKKHHIPFTNYVLDLWPENLYSVLPGQKQVYALGRAVGQRQPVQAL